VPVILALQEEEIRKTTVESQQGLTVFETLSQKIPSQKRAGGVTQDRGLEFKLQYCKKQYLRLNALKKINNGCFQKLQLGG
jgi:hypothetical protein